MKGVYPTNISDPYKCLAMAIVEKAVYDYLAVCAARRREIKETKKVSYRTRHKANELEDFFRSEWFELLCPYDGEAIIHACINRANRGLVVSCPD